MGHCMRGLACPRTGQVVVVRLVYATGMVMCKSMIHRLELILALEETALCVLSRTPSLVLLPAVRWVAK